MQDRVEKPASRRIRKQVLLTKEQAERLKALAEARGSSESTMIHQAIDELLAQHQPGDQNEDWKKGWRRTAGMWKDYSEIGSIMAEARGRRAARRERMKRSMRGEDL